MPVLGGTVSFLEHVEKFEEERSSKDRHFNGFVASANVYFVPSPTRPRHRDPPLPKRPKKYARTTNPMRPALTRTKGTPHSLTPKDPCCHFADSC